MEDFTISCHPEGRIGVCPERVVTVMHGAPRVSSEISGRIAAYLAVRAEQDKIISSSSAEAEGIHKQIVRMAEPQPAKPFHVLPSSSAVPEPLPVSSSGWQELRDRSDRLRRALRPTGSFGRRRDILPGRVRAGLDTARLLEQGLATAGGQDGPENRADVKAVAERAGALRHDLETFSASAGSGYGQQYRVQGPDGKVVARITPKPVPATLLVASELWGEVSATGLARWFPAHTIHAQNCGTVVDGNECTLSSQDHVHIQAVQVSFESFLEADSRAHAALMELLRDNTDKAVDEFQRVMREITGAPPERDTQASLPVRQAHLTVATGSAVVQQADQCEVNVTNSYVIECAELPICELLATDRAMVTAFLDALGGQDPGPAADAFARMALLAAGRTEDLDLLAQCTELHGPSASVRGLFGVEAVRQASVVLVGSSNTLKTSMRVDRGRPTLGGGLGDLGLLRQRAEPVLADRAARVAPPADSVQVDSAVASDDPSARILAQRDTTAPGLAGTPTAGRLGPNTALTSL
jgi:hypothetical protein